MYRKYVNRNDDTIIYYAKVENGTDTVRYRRSVDDVTEAGVVNRTVWDGMYVEHDDQDETEAGEDDEE